MTRPGGRTSGLPWRRVVTAGVVAATVGVVWLVADPGDRGPASADGVPAAAAAPATITDFCAAFETLAAAVSASSGQNTLAPAATDVRGVKAAAAAARDVGDRAPLPATARPGLVYVTDLLASLPEDARPEQIALSDDRATVTQSHQVDDFVAFLQQDCRS